MHNPLEQFEVIKFFDLHLFGYDFSFTNAALFMMIACAMILVFVITCCTKHETVPSRSQALAEMMYDMLSKVVESSAGPEAKRYQPLIFSVFLFILTCNLLGMIPFSFTVTSHIAVTFALAAFVFLTITAIGFLRHGLHYLSLFLPKGTPMFMAPMMIMIELFAYMVRPVSLSIRLAANMTAGHIVLKVLASFSALAGVILGFMPFGLLVVFTGFEIFIAVLQAYIFTVLSCVYLNDAVNLH